MPTISKVKKRDGRIVDFDESKIALAIWKSAESVGGKDRKRSEELAGMVTKLLEQKFGGENMPSVEDVQDGVEKVLIEEGHAAVAKAYILYRQKRAEVRQMKSMLGVNDELKFSLNAIKVMASRYLRRDEDRNIIESTAQLFSRVARAIAEPEAVYGGEERVKEYEQAFYEMMVNREFMPNSPTLMNAGTDLGQLSACFVLPVPDSIPGIFDSVKYTAIIHKSGGGTGFSFSRLRPKGDVVRSTGGVASGPLSFMQVFNAATEVIKQGGKRRGANMGMLRVDHPDIFEFITAKEREGILSNFNISVAVTDKFMRAVESNGEYSLVNPRDKKPNKSMPARAVFNLMVMMAWKNGEPGVVFIDKINAANPTPALGEIESTNPCVIGSTRVFTENGWVVARELKAGSTVWTPKGWAIIEDVIDNGVQATSRVELGNGMEIVVTNDHKFMTRNGWKTVKELAPDDEVKIVYDYPDEFGIAFDNRKSEWLGYWTGDGDVTSSDHVSLYPGKDQTLADHFSPITQELAGVCTEMPVNGQLRLDTHRKKFAGWVRDVTGTELSSASSEKRVPEIIMRADCPAQRGFLRGLFSADGSVYDANGTPTIALSSSSKALLQQTQLLLLSQGIPSTLTDEKPAGKKTIKGRVYDTMPTSRLIISGERAWIFSKKIGFIGEKAGELEAILSGKKHYSTMSRYEYVKIKSIEAAAKENVYDINAPPMFTWITNGILSLDCGEQPLLPYESCNLGSINMERMMTDGDIDWDKLRNTIRLAVRFLDNVVDVNKYPIPEIEKMTMMNRKIGLGVMGFADMLIKMGIPYNSEEAIRVSEKVMKFIQEESKKMSEELGAEKGDFEGFDKSVWAKRYKHMRNATTTTVAPTGTISVIANCSSGIEPIFAVSYVRDVSESLGHELVEINPMFETAMIERGLYNEELVKKVSQAGSVQSIHEVPEEVRRVFVTALEIEPEWHVRIQAAFQKYTDNAVSKTINFSNWATPHDVEKAFMLAWKLNCKGITVYRYGSREKQILKVVEKQSPPFSNENGDAGTYGHVSPSLYSGGSGSYQDGCPTCAI